MSHIKQYLPEVEKLKKELEQYPNKIINYIKCGVLMGSDASLDYLNKKLNEYYENKKD
jgi:hypothetical protein